MMALMDDLKSSAIKRKSLKSMKKAALNTTWSKPIKRKQRLEKLDN